MKRDLTSTLMKALSEGFRRIGQIRIQALEGGRYELRHIDDASATILQETHDPQAARHLSLTTASGEYRPMKTAPNLRRGWSLTVADIGELRIALDHFYPAMVGVWVSHLHASLRPVPLRETLDRQTGMYAASKRLQDEEGQQLVGSACAATNCLKRMLWDFAPGTCLSQIPPDKRSAEPVMHDGGEMEIPMICHEACNLLVAAAREVVKKRERAAQAAAPSHTS